MAIYIDIIARLNQQRLIKQGEDLRKYINGLEDEISDHRLRVARAESTKLIKFDDNVATSRDQLINKTDELTAARLRLKAADKSVRETETRTLKTDEDAAKQKKDNTAALKEQAAATQDLVYKLQAENRALRVNELAKRVLNEETKAHAKNLRDVADITDKNRGKFIRLSMVTNRLRRDVENLHTANITTLQDNSKANKSMEGLSESIKKTAREREKYNDVLLSKNPARIKAQGLVVERAMEAEARKAQDVQDVLVGLIEQRREHDSVVNQSETSLRGLANQSLQLEKRAIDLRSANRDVIDQNITLTRQFDRHSNSVLKVSNEYRKYHDMSQDVSVGSDALANQIENINKAVVEQQRALRDASYALDDYYKRQEDGEKRAAEAARRKREIELRKMKPQSMGQYFARNLGALTPLGTLSPTTLLPLAGILGTVGEAAVTASQSLALLPAAGVAAAAGIGTLIVGMKGFGDALSGMGDPKKFAEALYLLSPNAQQAALSIKGLVDGPLGDLKRATQDALFADVGATIQKLTGALGPAIQRMTTSIATSFNQMFTGISFDMMTPDMQERFGTITTNISAMFDRMVPAITAFNSAFMKIAETGSGFLPQMADALANVMNKFDAFITRAQNDGSLQNFIQKGIDAFAALSNWLLGFGQDIYEVFGNKSPEEFMNTLNGVKDALIAVGKLLTVVAEVIDRMAPYVGAVVDAFGGFENVLYALVGFGFLGWLTKILTLFKNLKTLIGPSFVALVGRVAGAFGLIGPAATTAAATAATAAGTAATAFGAAGATSASKYGGALMKGIKTLTWVGLGVTVAELIGNGLRDGASGWRDIVADAIEGTNPIELGNQMSMERYGYLIGPDGVRLPNRGPNPESRRRPFDDRNPFEDRQLRGVDPYTGLPLGPPIDPVTGRPVQLDANGQAMSESDILNMYRGQLAPESYAVDPFTDPITGQKTAPMLPIGPNGMPEYPTGGVPGTPSIQGPTMPQYNSFGQITGYGANMVDPEAVFDAQLAVQDKARDVEEANKDLLAAKLAGVLSAEEVNDLERKVLDEKRSLHKALVQLGEAQTGDVEKLKTATGDMLGEFGASLDKDFGISRGLSGIAENLTKFLANLAFAPAYGAARGTQAGLGFPLGEGTGHGLMGALATSRGYFKGGPRDAGASGYAPAYPGTPVAPSMGAPRLALNPNNVSTAGLKPQSMALLSLIQGMPQFAGVKLGSAKVGREGDAHKWHPNGQGLDFSLNANDPAQSALGDQLKAFLESNKALFGINHVLWKTMEGGNHFDHLHVGLNGSGNGKADTSPLVQGMGGVVPPSGGTSGVPSLASLSSGIPIPLPVTIVGGGMPALPGITPPAGTPGATPPAPGQAAGPTPWLAGQGTQPVTIPVAGRPAAPPASRPGWTYGPDGMPRSAPAGSGDALYNDAADWYRSRGLEPPPAYRNYGTKTTPVGPTPPVQGPPSVPMPPLPPYAKGGEVPIMAHSGEHVLTREDVAALGGQSGVYGFRRSLHSYNVGGAVPRAPFSPDPFDPSNIPTPPSAPPKPNPKDIIRPTDLGSLLGVGDSPPAAPAPKVPTVPEVPVISAPVVPAPAVPTLPETVLPSGIETPGSVIGAQAEAPAGYGGGFDINGGGLLGLAQQGLTMAATSGAGMAGMGAGGGGGGGAGGDVAAALASLGIETAIKLGERGIEYGAQVAGIATQGLLETFLPAGGSELASNNWLTRIVGGIAGAAPAMANLAGGPGAANQSMLPGVGGPPTPEQIAAQGMDPNRAQHTGAGAPAGPVNNIGVQIMEYRTEDNRPASQDFGRYAIPGQR